MPYKVVFVEDEIVTREGIRDNVDWTGNGFELCGEAPDGEIALHLIQSCQPDVLITDIKMPFMDGLQLCKIVRERMPQVIIIILSGHDEFEYAQEAIQVGASEYLLKPITTQDLHKVLQKIAAQLDRQQTEKENLHRLQSQVQENRQILRERFLLKLVVGAVAPGEAIERGQALDMDLLARCYLITIFKIELADLSDQFDYEEYQQIQQIISSLVEPNPDMFLLRKDWEELVVLMKGSTPEYLLEERDLLLERIQREVQNTKYRLVIGNGEPKSRIGHIHQSFIEALVDIQHENSLGQAAVNTPIDKEELLKVDKSAVENYLRCGVEDEFDAFFNAFIRPLGEAALKSHLIKNYIFVDVAVVAARFLDELGVGMDQAIPEFDAIEVILANINTIEQFREQVRKIMVGALLFRDRRAGNHHAGVIQQAREYIERNYANPNLLLNEVAAQVNLSPNHFSVIFSQETSQTFKEYLTEVRLKKAKELLRTTLLNSAEISYRVGYNDPHYFSYVFKKNTGFSPTEFRAQAQARPITA